MLSRLIHVLFAFVVFSVGANADAIEGIGIKKLAVSDPVDQRAMDAVVFFPSGDQSEVTRIGPYQIAASRSAAIKKGRYPLILLSHGNMGSMWGHHNLATSLARQGYVVVSVMHPGDNFQDTSRVGTTSALYGRPMQISAALTAVLGDPALAPHIDPEKIGFIGFSAGGTTGLILGGAKPVFGRLESYCANRPADRSVCEAQGRITTNTPELEPIADTRIRAFVLLAPLSVVFPPENLKLHTAPTLIFVGDKDEELSPQDNAIALAHDLPSGSRLKVIPEAGHFTYLAPCSPELTQAAPALCQDREGVDRVALHQTINAEIAGFFREVFDAAVR